MPIRPRLVLFAVVLVGVALPACNSVDYAELYVIAEYPEAIYAFGVAPVTAGRTEFMQMNISTTDGEAYAVAREMVQGFTFAAGAGEGPDRFQLAPAVDLGAGGVVEASVAARDILEMEAGDYMVVQVHVPVAYNFPKSTLDAWREGTSYRVTLSAPEGQMVSGNLLTGDAVKRALAQHYARADEDVPTSGSAWLLALKPLVARTTSPGEDAGVNLFTDPDVRLASQAGEKQLEWLAEVLVCPGYEPTGPGRVAEPSGNNPQERDEYPRQVEGAAEPAEGMGYGIGFAFSPEGTADLPYDVKETARQRAATFLPWTTHGFHFDKGTGTLAANAEAAPNLSAIPTTPFRTSRTRSFYVGRTQAPLALDLPEFGIARIRSEVTYHYDPSSDARLEALPRLLAYQAVQQYGGNNGQGYLEGDLTWDYDREEDHRLTIAVTVGLYRPPFEDD